MFKKIILGVILTIGILDASDNTNCANIVREMQMIIDKYNLSLDTNYNTRYRNTNIEPIEKVQAYTRVKQKTTSAGIKSKISHGRKIFISRCQLCHGSNANKKAYNNTKVRDLTTLSFNEMKSSIQGYQLNKSGKGLSIVMKHYAKKLTTYDIEAIYEYLQILR